MSNVVVNDKLIALKQRAEKRCNACSSEQKQDCDIENSFFEDMKIHMYAQIVNLP